ncbi:hypothetical protein GCM10010502_27130 [Kitasatospora aureofaciens]|uniref:Uncharacterized protein n=1 Tax=Kitasatospora aureofaciens TaxID=1894 RepID=A0A8H9LPL1_KITAU|nr:hypothetical protein GCM10010502_27130 [Kitasatospora aureofaciens]
MWIDRWARAADGRLHLRVAPTLASPPARVRRIFRRSTAAPSRTSPRTTRDTDPSAAPTTGPSARSHHRPSTTPSGPHRNRPCTFEPSHSGSEAPAAPRLCKATEDLVLASAAL